MLFEEWKNTRAVPKKMFDVEDQGSIIENARRELIQLFNSSDTHHHHQRQTKLRSPIASGQLDHTRTDGTVFADYRQKLTLSKGTNSSF